MRNAAIYAAAAEVTARIAETGRGPPARHQCMSSAEFKQDSQVVTWNTNRKDYRMNNNKQINIELSRANPHHAVCVYCGSRSPERAEIQAAIQAAWEAGWTIVSDHGESAIWVCTGCLESITVSSSSLLAPDDGRLPPDHPEQAAATEALAANSTGREDDDRLDPDDDLPFFDAVAKKRTPADEAAIALWIEKAESNIAELHRWIARFREWQANPDDHGLGQFTHWLSVMNVGFPYDMTYKELADVLECAGWFRQRQQP